MPARSYLAPGSEPEGIAFSLPDGACDCHAHVIAACTLTYPMVQARSYTPAAALEADYLQHLDSLRLDRGVLVQISVYGTDNRYLLEVLERHPQRLRGVVVIDPAISDNELQRMHRLGVRGARINTVFGGGVSMNLVERLATRIAPLGWHIQLLIDVRELPALVPRLRRLPCPCVVDHFGHLPATLGVKSAGFQALLHMATDYGWWVKLSGPYRISDQAGYADVLPLATELLRRVPQRLVWGSDWPHVAVARHPDTAALLNLLAQWVPDADLRRQVLVRNPAELYHFDYSC
jgi:predicted TIM-barrel fold metal-dependent hydrolase